IVAAIASDDGDPVDELMKALKALRVEKTGLTERLRIIDAETNVVSLHPKAIDKFAASMERMHKALSDGKLGAEKIALARAQFRNVFETFIVHVTAKRADYEVTPIARLGAIMGFDLFPKMSSVKEMLADQGVSAGSILSPSPR